MGRLNTILGMILSFAFIMAGSQKITPTISPPIHEHLVAEVKNWGPIWSPLLREALTMAKLEEHIPAAEKMLLDDGSKTYGVMLLNIGYLEVVCAAMLLASAFSGIATLLLICTMGAAIYTHQQLGQPFVPPAALLVLLIIKLLLPKGEAPKAAKTSSSSKPKTQKKPSKKD